MKPAEKIADYLFTNGAGKKAKRLVLEMEDGSNGGGWGREPVRDAIQDHIEELENELHRHPALLMGGSTDEVITKYAKQGLKFLGRSNG